MMGLFNIFKKTDIPEELPSLASENFQLDSLRVSTPLKKDSSSTSNDIPLSADLPLKISEVQTLPLRPIETPIQPQNSVVQKESRDFQTKGFFDELQNDFYKEIHDLDDLENWYEKKFLPQDVVSNMKNYWESQKSTSVLQVLGKNFKQRINEKTSNLQKFEKEWQNSYFDLIEKEEEIRKEEADLKKILSEFVEICKRKKVEENTLNNLKDNFKESVKNDAQTKEPKIKNKK